jgi:hypothetical protein
VGEEKKEIDGYVVNKEREEKKLKHKGKNSSSQNIEDTSRKKALTSGRAWLPLNGSTRHDEGTSWFYVQAGEAADEFL